ncbi:endonuclease 2-like [Salvia miltiorrhiza]|uniref:endonuclease 2-like n=1 Tax=Salvia miltiorrhiza TaxID=226208 RepID=UPI0025AD0C6A|nr:endonuclease 2-like [Salvia miltiorrhiza]
MENGKLFHIILISFSLIIIATPCAHGWGYEGHTAVCRIAQARLSKAAAAVVKKLLPAYANGNLGALCPWADTVKFRYPWSRPLHFINTPDHLCSYSYARDCIDKSGEKGFCLAGAINNYTNELLDYNKKKQQYNLTESLLFASHFMGDIHQPLHVGFTSDKGGNTINVKWFKRTTELHHVWDTDIIKKAQGKGANATDMNGFSQWRNQVKGWVFCTLGCTNSYATESITAACQWAYKGVQSGSTLADTNIVADKYFNTRLPVVELRLAQAGVRLASALNQIFT